MVVEAGIGWGGWGGWLLKFLGGLVRRQNRSGPGLFHDVTLKAHRRGRGARGITRPFVKSFTHIISSPHTHPDMGPARCPRSTDVEPETQEHEETCSRNLGQYVEKAGALISRGGFKQQKVIHSPKVRVWVGPQSSKCSRGEPLLASCSSWGLHLQLLGAPPGPWLVTASLRSLPRSSRGLILFSVCLLSLIVTLVIRFKVH